MHRPDGAGFHGTGLDQLGLEHRRLRGLRPVHGQEAARRGLPSPGGDGLPGAGSVWHSGLSASAPFLVATPKHFLEKDIGIIPITETIFHPFNLLLALAVLIFLTIIGPLMHPKKGDEIEADPKIVEEAAFEPPIRPTDALTPALKLEHSPLINMIVGLCGLIWLFWYFGTKGLAGINLNTVNFAFLMLGVLLHQRPAALLAAAEQGGRYVWGVILQFPFYAGIYGMIQSSKLQDVIAGLVHRGVAAQYLSVDRVVVLGTAELRHPVGGVEVGDRGPLHRAGRHTVGANLDHTVLAYAWGDMLTDIIQPFLGHPAFGRGQARL